MQCFFCNAVSTVEANFCGTCGRHFRSQADHGNRPKDARWSNMKSPYPHDESINQWHELKRQRLSLALTWVGVLGLSAILIGRFYLGSNLSSLISFFPVVFGLIIGINVFIYVKRVRGKHYYGIAHSRDNNGNHRCIFCGNRGIYKQGEYKTNNTHCHCSKCEKLLYSK